MPTSGCWTAGALGTPQPELVMPTRYSSYWDRSSAASVNLGWCNDARHACARAFTRPRMCWRGACFCERVGSSPSAVGAETGNMAHELGHILGMNHEQKRPDGPASYYGPWLGRQEPLHFLRGSFPPWPESVLETLTVVPLFLLLPAPR